MLDKVNPNSSKQDLKKEKRPSQAGKEEAGMKKVLSQVLHL